MFLEHPRYMLRTSRVASRQSMIVFLLLTVLLDAQAQPDIGQDTIIPNTQHGVVVGAKGHIYSTHNGGFAWVRQRLVGGRQVDLSSAFVFDDTSAVAVGGDCFGEYDGSTCGVFFREAGRSTADEFEWIKAPLDVDGALGNNLRALTFVTFCSHLRGFVVGEQGSILYSANGGLNWGASPSGSLDHLRSVHCLSDDLILVGGDNGAVLRSSDGGATWALPSALPDPSFSLVGFIMQTSRFGFAVGNNAYTTSDRGVSWARKVINVSLPVRAVYLSQGADPDFSTAVIAERGSTRLLQMLRRQVGSGHLHNSSIEWTEEGVVSRLDPLAVALGGLPENCSDCNGILISGVAVSSANTGCERGKRLTCDSRVAEDRNFRCCGPLQFRPKFTEPFSTAIYSPSAQQQAAILAAQEAEQAAAELEEEDGAFDAVDDIPPPDPSNDLPVGCDDIVGCVALSAVAFSTGRTPGPARDDGGGTDGDDGAVGPDVETLAVEFHVDVGDYSTFQLSLFVDNIVDLLDIPYTPEATGSDRPDGLLLATLLLRDDNATGFDSAAAVRALVGIAEEDGKGSEICDSGTRTVVVPGGAWGAGGAMEAARSIEVDCEQKGLRQTTAIVLIVVLSFYVLVGVLLAFLFSLPKYWTVPKHLPTAYGLWFFFGLLGVHRFYLKVPFSGVVYMFTAGIFGLGWLADAVLLPFLYNAACFDQGRENTGYVSGRIRNAARPNFVTRRQALNMMAEVEHGDKEDEEQERGAEVGGELDPGQLVEDLQLETAHPGASYVSPLLYPSAAMMSSEQYLRSQELNQAQRGYTTHYNDGEADGTDGYLSVVA